MFLELEVGTEAPMAGRALEGRRAIRFRSRPDRQILSRQDLATADELVAANPDVLLPPGPLIVDVATDKDLDEGGKRSHEKNFFPSSITTCFPPARPACLSFPQ